ncbi:TetR/AcrR family transcriptional regulator [Rhodococcus chondri]|uniref:TetR/AcrR family transcriptional regulator n=1 Tax=Rhodococcus chondri TaxID=3065941 RepID=A0ABU7JL49_9NOCA|nr:TetR/AcrR family transcriptional regulator [Rhodococcus sp. CC-R104]MEE2030746.1 TetR/AcrR family transcriptional regulator [Rhodococcus sp. CC-R104]
MTTEVERDAPGAWRRFEPLQLGPILECALEAFSENGFHGTTVRDLARRVGVTVPALYYHHENKEAVLVTLLDAAVLDLIDRVLAAVAAGGDDPVARFGNAVEAIVLNMTHRAKRSSLDSELRHVSPENRRTYAASRKRLELIMLDLVRDGAEQDVFAVDDIDESVRAMLGMFQSIARWYQLDGPLTPAQVADRYTAIALRIVGHHDTA